MNITGNTMPGSVVLFSDDQKFILSQCREFKLPGFAIELNEQYSNPELYKDLNEEKKLLRCFDEQRRQLNSARFEGAYRRSGVKFRHGINEFVPDPAQGLTPEIRLLISECNYISQGLNIIITGPAGTGKTAVAKAIANEVMRRGESAMFYRLSELSLEIEQKSQLAFSRLVKKLSRIKLLVIDDYGLTKLPDAVACGLVEIASARYGRGTTVITTQLRKTSLSQVMDKSPIRDALCDRLFRPSDLEIVLKGASWRGRPGELK